MIIKLIKRLLNIKSPSIALTLTPEKAESIIEAFEDVIGKSILLRRNRNKSITIV